MAASILYRIHLQQGNSASQPGLSQPEVTSQVAEKISSMKDHPALAPPTAKNVTTEAGRNAAESLVLVRPDLESFSSKWLAADGVEPEAKALFDDGFRLMRVGSLREAREAFRSLINTYPESRLAAPAYWAIGLAYYQEGGNENLLEAVDQFKNFLIFFGNSEQAELLEPSSLSFRITSLPSIRIEQEELTKAAQIDIAVINTQLMGSTTQETGKKIYAAQAANALKTFLARWPFSPYAPAARIQLNEIQNLLSDPR